MPEPTPAMPIPTAAPTEPKPNAPTTRGPRRRPWRGAPAVVWLVAHAAILATLAWAADPPGPPVALDETTARVADARGSREGDAWRSLLVADADEEVRVGAELYDRNCSVCHGDTGLGYAEAKLAFPADHRTCTRCHRPGNPAQMSFEEMMLRQHDLFDLGVPPALRGPGALQAFTDPISLWAYTDATMPRYQPGRLEATEVRAIVGFLWHANGRDATAARTALQAVVPGPTPPAPPSID